MPPCHADWPGLVGGALGTCGFISKIREAFLAPTQPTPISWHSAQPHCPCWRSSSAPPPPESLRGCPPAQLWAFHSLAPVVGIANRSVSTACLPSPGFRASGTQGCHLTFFLLFNPFLPHPPARALKLGNALRIISPSQNFTNTES